MKTCSHCKIEKPLTDFYKNKSKKDGLQNVCNFCTNERKKIANRTPAYREAQKSWIGKNLEKSRQIKRTWASKNKESSTRWFMEHPGYQQAKTKEDVDGLSDRYIRTLFWPHKYIPTELIEAKRLHIQIIRKLKELKE